VPAARGPDAASDAQRNGSRLSFMQRLQDARSRFRPLASSHSRRNLVPLHELLRATRPRDAFHERPHAESHFRICEDLRNQKARVIGRETVESSGVVRLAQASELPSEVFDKKARERTRTSAVNLPPFKGLAWWDFLSYPECYPCQWRAGVGPHESSCHRALFDTGSTRNSSRSNDQPASRARRVGQCNIEN